MKNLKDFKEEWEMNCNSCGNVLVAGSLFCNKCGKAVALSCPSCGVTLAEGSIFCNMCGAQLSGGQTYVYEDRDTGAKYKSDIAPEEFNIVADTVKPGFDLEDWLDENITDPKTRQFLVSVYGKVVWIGKQAVKIGRFILGIILKFKENFPQTFNAIIVTFIVSAILSMIPFIGSLLAGAACIFFGVTQIVPAILNDTMQKTLRADIREDVQAAMSAAMNNFALAGANKIAKTAEKLVF